MRFTSFGTGSNCIILSGSSCLSLYTVSSPIVALGLFLPLGIILAVIICLFLAFLAVCDAAPRKSNVLNPHCSSFVSPASNKERRKRKTELINCQERVSHRQEWFALPCFCPNNLRPALLREAHCRGKPPPAKGRSGYLYIFHSAVLPSKSDLNFWAVPPLSSRRGDGSLEASHVSLRFSLLHRHKQDKRVAKISLVFPRNELIRDREEESEGRAISVLYWRCTVKYLRRKIKTFRKSLLWLISCINRTIINQMSLGQV